MSGTRVYVGNLSWQAQWQDLKDHMRGPNQDLNVLRADIMSETTGRSRGCALVEYASNEDAERAIGELNDTSLLDRVVFVREDRETPAQGSGRGSSGLRSSSFLSKSVGSGYDSRGSSLSSTRVYVGNLSWQTQWQDLKDFMRGPNQDLHVLHVDIMYEPNGRSKGCALVEYASKEDAERAIGELNDMSLMNRVVFVREDRETAVQGDLVGDFARDNYDNGGYGVSVIGYPGSGCNFGVKSSYGPGGGSSENGCRVFVGNLSWDCKWQDLKDHMRLTGEVLHADVLQGPDGRAKGCGIVEYQAPHEAQQAIQALHDTELMGRLIFVREDREDDKTKRKRLSGEEDGMRRKR